MIKVKPYRIKLLFSDRQSRVHIYNVLILFYENKEINSLPTVPKVTSKACIYHDQTLCENYPALFTFLKALYMFVYEITILVLKFVINYWFQGTISIKD